MGKFFVKLICILAFGLSAMLAVYFVAVIYDVYCQHEKLTEKTESLNRKIASFAADNDYKKSYHERLANDDEFAARVIRETLGYVGEREIVFKFDEMQFSPKTGKGVTVESGFAKKEKSL